MIQPYRHRWAVGIAMLLTVQAHAIDRGADGEFDHRSSAHFELYQDVDIDRTSGFHGSRRFEQQILAKPSFREIKRWETMAAVR